VHGHLHARVRFIILRRARRVFITAVRNPTANKRTERTGGLSAAFSVAVVPRVQKKCTRRDRVRSAPSVHCAWSKIVPFPSRGSLRHSAISCVRFNFNAFNFIRTRLKPSVVMYLNTFFY